MLAKQGLFNEVMDDDLNAAGAVGHIFDMARDVNLFLAGPETAGKRLVLKGRAGQDQGALERARHLPLDRGGDRQARGPAARTFADCARSAARARAAKDWASADTLRNRAGRPRLLPRRPARGHHRPQSQLADSPAGLLPVRAFVGPVPFVQLGEAPQFTPGIRPFLGPAGGAGGGPPMGAAVAASTVGVTGDRTRPHRELV